MYGEKLPTHETDHSEEMHQGRLEYCAEAGRLIRRSSEQPFSLGASQIGPPAPGDGSQGLEKLLLLQAIVFIGDQILVAQLPNLPQPFFEGRLSLRGGRRGRE